MHERIAQATILDRNELKNLEPILNFWASVRLKNNFQCAIEEHEYLEEGLNVDEALITLKVIKLLKTRHVIIQRF